NAGVVFGVEFGKGLAVAPADDDGHRILRFLRRERPRREAGEAPMDIEGPIDGLAVFAVADDIDARLGLAAHGIGDGVREGGLESGRIVGLAGVDLAQELDQRWRPNEAADMRDQNSIVCLRHDPLPCVTTADDGLLYPALLTASCYGDPNPLIVLRGP